MPNCNIIAGKIFTSELKQSTSALYQLLMNQLHFQIVNITDHRITTKKENTTKVDLLINFSSVSKYKSSFRA